MVTAVAACRDTQAQLIDPQADAKVAAHGEPVVGQFQVGAEITARGAVRDIKAVVAVPLECDEQEVRIAQEDFSSEVASVEYRDLKGGLARQMVIEIPYLAAGATARAVVTYDVTTRPVLPPEDTDTAKLTIPDKPDREVRNFLSASPYIEARHSSIRRLARGLMKDADEKLTDWQRVELLYDAMLDKVQYVEGPDKSALDTLRDGSADCHGRSAVFIALCRAAGIPARVVWVNNHCYAEFYLEDESGEGAWHPVESAGSRAFGEMPLARVILQKGDNFRLPEKPRERLRYATDFLIGKPVGGGGQPRAKFIREPL